MAEIKLVTPSMLFPITPKTKMTLAIRDATTVTRVCVRGLTLAVGLVGVVPAVVGSVADPRRVDAQGCGVAADKIPLLRPQLVKVRTVAVV